MDSVNSKAPDLSQFFSDFDPARCRVIARSTQGLIVHARVDGLELAIKTPTETSRLRRLHRFALPREYAAYQRLEGVAGFARCFGLFDNRYLALEYLDAISLKKAELADREQFFDRLLEVMRAMHERGVAHGDLKSRHNVMAGPDGQPYIIDLGTAVLHKPGWHPINNRIFRYLKRIDRNGWIKLKYGGYGQVDDADRHLIDRTLAERLHRRIRRR